MTTIANEVANSIRAPIAPRMFNRKRNGGASSIGGQSPLPCVLARPNRLHKELVLSTRARNRLLFRAQIASAGRSALLSFARPATRSRANQKSSGRVISH